LVVYFEADKKRYATGIDRTSDEWNKIWKTNLRDDDLRLIKRMLNAKRKKQKK
jgi:hypothetical protein